MQQRIVLAGRKLLKPDETVAGTVIRQITDLTMCDQHPDCPGPVVQFRWEDGRERRECLYVLIKGKGYKLR